MCGSTGGGYRGYIPTLGLKNVRNMYFISNFWISSEPIFLYIPPNQNLDPPLAIVDTICLIFRILFILHRVIRGSRSLDYPLCFFFTYPYRWDILQLSSPPLCLIFCLTERIHPLSSSAPSTRIFVVGVTRCYYANIELLNCMVHALFILQVFILGAVRNEIR